MPQQAEAAPVGAIELCYWHPQGKNNPPCNKPATHRIRWPWGEEGHICPECIALAQQTGRQLKREPTLQTLNTSEQQPVTLHERTHLIAAKLSAEAELKEVTLKGQQLYQSNVSLTQQVQTLTMQKRELEGHVAQHQAELSELGNRLEARETELADVVAERDRLATLVPFVGKETTPTERGLPTSTVVD
jgi:hypothetical protein